MTQLNVISGQRWDKHGLLKITPWAREHQGNWQLQRNRNLRKIADFNQATDFQISRRTLWKLMFD
jgi:hypothetical protein